MGTGLSLSLAYCWPENGDRICPCHYRIISLKMGTGFVPVPSVLLAGRRGRFVPGVLLAWKWGQNLSLFPAYWPENGDMICPCPSRIISLKMGTRFAPVHSVLLAWKLGRGCPYPQGISLKMRTGLVPGLSVLLAWRWEPILSPKNRILSIFVILLTQDDGQSP